MSLLETRYWERDPNKAKRRVEFDIKKYLSPREIYEIITKPENAWKYKRDFDAYFQRDQALVSLDYLGVLRISELLGILKSQLEFQAEKQRWMISGVKLGKVRSLSNPKWRERHEKWREVWLPFPKSNSKERREQDQYRLKLTRLFIDYAQTIQDCDRLFPISRWRAWAIFNKFTGGWPHYFRACGMKYIYEAWDNDLVAVCKYVKISERTAMRYLGSVEREAV